MHRPYPEKWNLSLMVREDTYNTLRLLSDNLEIDQNSLSEIAFDMLFNEFLAALEPANASNIQSFKDLAQQRLEHI